MTFKLISVLVIVSCASHSSPRWYGLLTVHPCLRGTKLMKIPPKSIGLGLRTTDVLVHELTTFSTELVFQTLRQTIQGRVLLDSFTHTIVGSPRGPSSTTGAGVQHFHFYAGRT